MPVVSKSTVTTTFGSRSFLNLLIASNGLYIALFILLAIYFAVKKKNLFLAVMFVAIGTLIKYVAIFALPFIVLYLLKENTSNKNRPPFFK